MDKYKSEKIKSYISELNKHISVADLDDVLKKARNKNIISLCDEDFFSETEKNIQSLRDKNISGAIVLVGIWRGGSAMYVKQLIDDLKLNLPLYLIDTYEGFNESPDSEYRKDYSTFKFLSTKFPAEENPGIKEITENFKKFTVGLNNVHFIKANDHESFNKIEKIAFLHIDVDMYQPTYFYLNLFYSKIHSECKMIVDDYGVNFFNCNDAVDRFIFENKIAQERIQYFKNICIIQKE